ncbi:hypothetical protein AAY473_004080 [Plecturocebus cupreus]
MPPLGPACASGTVSHAGLLGAPARRPSRIFLLTALKQRPSEPLRERPVPGAPACLALPGVLGAGWGAFRRPQPQRSAFAARVSRGRRALGKLHEAAPARPPLRWAPAGSSGQEGAAWLECGARPRRATPRTPAPSHLDAERERAALALGLEVVYGFDAFEPIPSCVIKGGLGPFTGVEPEARERSVSAAPPASQAYREVGPAGRDHRLGKPEDGREPALPAPVRAPWLWPFEGPFSQQSVKEGRTPRSRPSQARDSVSAPRTRGPTV